MDLEIAKEYDRKINEELKKYETLLWQTYYSTTFPDFMQEYADNYSGAPEDKDRAVKAHGAALIAKHTLRVQKLLDVRRGKLIRKYLDDLIQRIEAAQREADLEEEEWNPEDYIELETKEN